jgi:hypothetical protein
VDLAGIRTVAEPGFAFNRPKLAGLSSLPESPSERGLPALATSLCELSVLKPNLNPDPIAYSGTKGL